MRARIYPRVAGNGNDSTFARLVGKTQQQNRVRLLTFAVVDAENQNVRVAVEFGIGLTHARGFAVVVALIHFRQLVVGADARVVNREADEQYCGTYQAQNYQRENQAKEFYPAPAIHRFAFLFYVVLGRVSHRAPLS